MKTLIKLTFTAEDIERLHYERFHHPHPRVQRKMEALYLKNQGYPHWEIAQLIRVTEREYPTFVKTPLGQYMNPPSSGSKRVLLQKWDAPSLNTEPTLLGYFRDYQAGGVAKLKELTFYQPQSELQQHQETLEDYFRKHPLKTLAQAAAKIG